MNHPTRTILLEVLAVLMALAAAAALASSSALAAGGLAIDQTGSPVFPERTYALQTPDRVALTPGALTVTENGEAVGDVTLESAATGSQSFGTVLAIDASDSMRGEPISAAMDAARTFARRRSSDQQLGVVTFNDRPSVALELTDDAARIKEALATTPSLSPSTHLYDAIDMALAMLSGSGVEAGSIVVLSDGADNGSVTPSAEVITRAEAEGIRIFAVGLRSSRFDPQALEQIAVGAAAVEASSPQALAPILDRFGARLASEHLLAYRSHAEPGSGVTVEVQVDGVDGLARDFYNAPAASDVAKDKPRAEEGFWASSTAMLIAIALAAGLIGTALFVVLQPQRVTVRDRLARFIHAHNAGSADERAADEKPSGPLFVVLERAVRGRAWWARFEEDLEIAAIRTPAIRIVAATVMGTALLVFLFAKVFGAPVLAPLALIVPVAVRGWIRRELRETRREFAEQLADNLQLVASALRAGQSMAGALAVVVEEASDVSQREFRRIVNDERLGVPLEDAIRDVARRMDNRDLEQVALVATLQREAGGNTAEVLDQVIATIRERGKLRRMMETLTAQGRLTQIIISALPVVLLCAVTLLNPDYMAPLFETGAGRVWLGVGAVLSVVGSMVIKRIVEVRV